MITPAQEGYALYARLSRKKVGRAKRRRNELETVELQLSICREFAAAEGIPVSEDHVYVDNHLSAWKPGGRREDWTAMMAAAERGEFPGLLVYRLDRFTRNREDGLALVRFARKKGFIVDGPNSGRFNLRTAQGVKQFVDAVNGAAYESDVLSERVRDKVASRVANGLQLGGGRIYGFEVLGEVREYDDDVLPVQRPAEVAVLREAAGRMLAGETLKDIAADLNGRGLLTSAGGPWTGGTLARTLGAPRYGGYIVYNGKTIGKRKGEPVFDDKLFAEVQAFLGERRRGPQPTGLWKLTGALMCGNPRCIEQAASQGRPPRTMSGHRNPYGRQYVCAQGNGGCGLSGKAEAIEAIVAKRVLEDVNDADLTAQLAGEAAALEEARAAADAEITRLQGELVRLETRRIDGNIDDVVYEATVAHTGRRLAEAKARKDALPATARAGGRRRGRTGARMTPEQYAGLTAEQTRTLIRELRLEVSLLPPVPGAPRNRFDPRRVQILP